MIFGIKIYNIMSGQNFTGGAFSSTWIMAWIGLFIIVLLIILTKKYLGEEQMAGPYSFIGGFLGALVYFLCVSFTGSPKWSFVIGIIGIALGGFGGGRYFENG